VIGFQIEQDVKQQRNPDVFSPGEECGMAGLDMRIQLRDLPMIDGRRELTSPFGTLENAEWR